MRILFLTNYYPPYEVGGYEQLCRDVAEQLEARGHTISVLTSDRGLWGDQKMTAGEAHRLLRIQPQYGAGLSPALQFFLTRRRIEAYNRRTCRAIAEQFRPDIVFIWNLEGLPYELATDAEAWPGVAVAYWLAHYSPAQPDSFWQYWAQPPAQRAFLGRSKDMLRRVALAQMRREGKPVRPLMRHVAVVSEWMRHKGLAENTLPGHTEVIYNGVEAETFQRPIPSPQASPPINLLLAGRVSPDKGIHVAIEALAALTKIRPQRDFHLIIAGSGPADYLEYLRQLAATHGIQDVVSFLGWLPRERIPALMHTCHILLLTAIYPEAFSRVVLEGMAAGLAVIGTRSGGTEELLRHDLNGLTCAPGDSQDLARQIGRLLDDPHLRYRLACHGQEMVLTRYSLEHMVKRIETFLERAVEQNKRHD